MLDDAPDELVGHRDPGLASDPAGAHNFRNRIGHQVSHWGQVHPLDGYLAAPLTIGEDTGFRFEHHGILARNLGRLETQAAAVEVEPVAQEASRKPVERRCYLTDRIQPCEFEDCTLRGIRASVLPFFFGECS